MDSSSNATCNGNNGPEIPFVPFLFALVSWVVLKIILESVVQRFWPDFVEDLKVDIRKKYNFYFATWMGNLFKAVGLVSCTAALFTTSAETDIAGLMRPLNVAEQWCWGCRALLYIQELPEMSAFPELVIHHLLSLVAMMSILYYNLPRRQMYLIWAGLLNEFIGNARRILKLHDAMTPRRAWWMALFNCLLLCVFRIGPAFVALFWAVRGGMRGVSLFINIGSISVYIIYMCQMVRWELARFKIITLDLTRPAHVVIVEKWRINLLGIFMGGGLLATNLSALMLYEFGSDRVNSESELQSIMWVMLQGAVVSLLGAYLTSPFLKFSKGMGPRPWRLSLLGGFLSATATIFLSPTLVETVDRSALAACLALSYPLMDTVAHLSRSFFLPVARGVAQHASASSDAIKVLDGENLNKGDKETLEKPPVLSTVFTVEPRLSLQLIASLLSGLIYVTLLVIHIAGYLDLYQTAGLSLILLSAIRFNIDSRRADVVGHTEPLYKRFSFWSQLPQLFQAFLGLFYLAYIEWQSAASHWSPGPMRSVYIFAIVVLSADIVINVLSRPKKTKQEKVPSSPRSDHEEKGRNGTRRASSSSSGLKGLRGMAVAAAVGMCILIALGEHFGIMISQVHSVDQALEGAENRITLPETALWNATSSWQLALSVVGVTVLPVFMVQLTG